MTDEAVDIQVEGLFMNDGIPILMAALSRIERVLNWNL